MPLAEIELFFWEKLPKLQYVKRNNAMNSIIK